jgi:anti-sigma regulatory factor (Ser/Thr protein kinase)
MSTTNTASLTVPAAPESVTRCIEFVAARGAAVDLPLARVRELELIVEEVVVNICQHAYGDAPGEIEFFCETTSSQELVLEFIDSGRPFNMLTLPAPDLTAEVEQRPVGGLGVPLVRALAETATYRRKTDRNILRLSVRLTR